MYTLDEFITGMANNDMQRSNMYSVVFATSPASRVLDSAIGGFANNILPDGDDAVDQFIPNRLRSSIRGEFTRFMSSTLDSAMIALNKTGFATFLGALSPRLITSILGDSMYGSLLTEFRDKVLYNMGLTIQSVQLPGKALGYEYFYNGGIPQIRFTRPDNGELSITFRTDSEGRNVKIFHEWMSAIRDDVTGQFAFIDEVTSTIQVNLHDRDSIPHTTFIYQKCVPVKITLPELSYENNNEIWTFTVDFAYKTCWPVEADKEGWKGFLENVLASTAQEFNPLNTDR